MSDHTPDLINDWRHRHQLRLMREAAEVRRRKGRARFLRIAFFAVVAIVAYLDQSGALNHLAGGR